MPRLTGSDDLFELIKSLSKEEKGYFVKFAKRHSEKGSQLLTLFNLISRQEKFDEKVLKQKIKHLPVLKNMLFDKILQSIYVGNNTLSITRQIERNTAFAGILFERGLVNKSIKLIEQSFNTAVENDLTTRALVLHSLLEDLTINSIAQEERWEKINDFYKTESGLIETITAHSKLFFEERKASYISRLEDETEVKKKLKNIDLKEVENPANLKTSLAKLVQLTTLMLYYQLKGNSRKHFEVSEENLAFQQKICTPKGTAVQRINLLVALMNHCNSCIDTGNLNDAEKCLRQLKKSDCSHQGIQLHKTFCQIHVQQELYFWRNEFSKGAEFSVKAFEQNQLYKEAGNQIFVFIAILQNKCLFHFLSSDFQNAYVTTQQLRFYSKPIQNQKLNAEILLMEIIIQTANDNKILAAQLFSLLTKWNNKGKLFSKKLIASLHSVITQKQISTSKTNYFIFNKLSLDDCIESLTAKKQLSLMAAKTNKRVMQQKKISK
jgi:hypothetical protein